MKIKTLLCTLVVITATGFVSTPNTELLAKLEPCEIEGPTYYWSESIVSTYHIETTSYAQDACGNTWITGSVRVFRNPF